jgi:Fic family protein
MLIPTPAPPSKLRNRLAQLDELHRQLGEELTRPGRWMGTLRRLARVIAVESSTAIEGFHVSHDDAVSLVTGAAAAPPGDANRMAVAAYARAMEHVVVMADDPDFRWLDRVVLDLHYDACRFQRDKRPGRWRDRQVGVVRGDGRIIYQAPSAEDVPNLMREVVAWLESGDRDAHVVVRAAMAHLHLAAVHPFQDGNGRVARIIQSLVLARDGILAPELASIEQYLGEHTAEYYRVLRRVNGPSYGSKAEALPWLDFCVEAHLEQARRRLAEIEQAAERWERLERLAKDRSWPNRLVIALEQALIGGIDRARYAAEADIPLVTATTDLRRLVDAGLLVARGAGRATRYAPSDALRAAVAG